MKILKRFKNGGFVIAVGKHIHIQSSYKCMLLVCGYRYDYYLVSV